MVSDRFGGRFSWDWGCPADTQRHRWTQCFCAPAARQGMQLRRKFWHSRADPRSIDSGSSGGTKTGPGGRADASTWSGVQKAIHKKDPIGRTTVHSLAAASNCSIFESRSHSTDQAKARQKSRLKRRSTGRGRSSLPRSIHGPGTSPVVRRDHRTSHLTEAVLSRGG